MISDSRESASGLDGRKVGIWRGISDSRGRAPQKRLDGVFGNAKDAGKLAKAATPCGFLGKPL
ncbi:MAG: hypothetical protein Q7T82_20205 [Armatimonadota bacterium]|nr:hypothetical protein [Armatimonadota bacterium]